MREKIAKILLTGGGSGGHVYPLIAIAQKLKEILTKQKIAFDIRYFGPKDIFDNDFKREGVKTENIISGKFRRYFSILNLFDAVKFFVSLFQILAKLILFRPGVVFSKGGPGSLAVLIISKLLFIPIIIHESDNVPGLSNIIGGKLARKIFISFESTNFYFKNKNVQLSGVPIKQNVFSNEELDSDTCKKSLGFHTDIPVIFILGGSQGAVRINDFVLNNLDNLLSKFQIIHQVGINNYKQYKIEFEFVSKDWPQNLKNRYIFKAYFDDDLPLIYSAADIVLSRAGAGTIYELAYFGKPAILIPFPEAANDHQNKNAQQYASEGAALVINQKNFLSHLVIDKISNILDNKNTLNKMSQAAYSFYKPNAANDISLEILKIIK